MTATPGTGPASQADAPSLWKHQREALDFIAGKPGAMLALDMGCGKTLTAIEHIRRTGARRILVIAPLSVVDHVWPDQVTRHAGKWLDLAVLGQNRKSTPDKIQAAQAAIARANGNRALAVVVNYETTLRPEFRKWAMQQPWDMLILDESHRVKAPEGKMSQWISQLAKRIPRRLGLTGTPMPHSPIDLFSQYRILDPQVFGPSFHRFRDAYAVTAAIPVTGRNGQTTEVRKIVGAKNLDQLSEKFHSIAYEVRAEDVLDLPPVNRVHYRVRLSPRAQAVYAQLAEHFIAELENGALIHAPNALAKLLRLQQITSGFAPSGNEGGPATQVDDAKSRAAAEILDSLPPDEPIVIFARFLHDLDVCKQAARDGGHDAWELSGRTRELREWNENGGALAVQIQAGGVGLDLTKARYCIFYSLGYSLGDYLQAQARLHRPGQAGTVHQIHLIAAGTVDEKVMKSLEKREDVVMAILESGALNG